MSTNVSEVRAASIIRTLMMKAAHTSETSVNIRLKHGSTSQKILSFKKLTDVHMGIPSVVGLT
jgi:hypothetical protein